MRRVRGAVALLVALLAGSSAAGQGSQSGSPGALDFEFFRTRIQPIFLAKRPGHARCVSCHVTGTPMRLQPLSPGRSDWTEEESRKNFEAVRRAVVPGSLQSKLLIHPLAAEAGGDIFHNGGKHWNSQTDPEWQTLAAWVMSKQGQRGDKR